MTAQGWYRDPYGVHEDRYFSAGHPTKLVRDGDAEAYDAPPPGPPKEELVEASGSQATDGSDLMRADADEADLPYDRNKAFWAVMDSAAVYGPLN